MEANVLIKCPLCGKDISVDSPRFTIGEDSVCEYCASSMTLEEIFDAEKISGVSFFDGKMWNNPFNGPDYEGDTGVEYDVEIPATPYDKYVAAWEEKYNPNRMSSSEYEKWFFEGKSPVRFLSREEFDAKGYGEDDISRAVEEGN